MTRIVYLPDRTAVLVGSTAGLVAIAITLFFRALAMNEVLVLQQANYAVSVIAAVHGFSYFVIHGGSRVTAPGIFMAASASFVGVGGWMVAADPYFLLISKPQEYLNIALCACVATQVGIGFLITFIPLREQKLTPPPLPHSTIVRAQWIGVLILISVALFYEGLGIFREGFAFTGAALISLSSMMSQTGLRSARNVIFAITPIAIYAVVFHNGTGRLRVVALIGAAGFALFLRYGNQWAKLFAVCGLPIGLAILGAWRIAFEQSLTGVVGNESGLSSMMAPIGIFAVLLHAFSAGATGPMWGSSFLSPLHAVVPEGWVPGWIPQALGYELADLIYPERSGSGFSTVASIYGDWWWNFAWVGIILAIPIMGILLATLDRWAIVTYFHSHESLNIFLVFVLLSALIGSIGDLVWSGFHTWTVRMFARSLVILALLMLAHLMAKRMAGSRRDVGRGTSSLTRHRRLGIAAAHEYSHSGKSQFHIINSSNQSN